VVPIPARNSFVPRYIQIEQALRERIDELAPGDSLPSDAELCAEFGVSRMTARNAMTQLIQERLVERVPGRGTFVARPPTHRHAGNLLSFSNEMRRRGRVASSRMIARDLRGASEVEAAELWLRAGADVVVVRRVRLADDEPIAVETSVLPGTCALIVLEADLEHDSLHAVLVAARRIPTRGRGVLDAQQATDDDAELLGLPRGSALLVERRLILDQHNRPLERTESRYAGERYALDLEFDVENA
jgi:GntR family transcriptional regulator